MVDNSWIDNNTLKALQRALQSTSTPSALEQSEFLRAYELYQRARRSYRASIKPADFKIKAAIERVCAELPFRFTFKISEIRFGPEGVTDPGFEVVYMGGKAITFHNIDEFPTDADIGRILLECP